MPEGAHQGRLLSRREAVRLLGGGMAWLIAGGVLARPSAAGPPRPECLFRPEQTEGPYFVDERLHRSDIRPDPTTGEVKAGVPFALTVALSRVDHLECKPLAGAQVDIWHCDALGIYSDVNDPSFNTIGKKFLRGYQLTDERGEARFLTVYPGWYSGRTVHVHVKVRTTVDGKGTYEFTSQIYFEDAFSDRVFASAPYAAKGRRSARNQDDRIFRRGGEQLMVMPTQSAEGYAAVFAAGLQLPSR
jgi:protocatechuate 3,4-dioxygenase beta subunit